MKRIDPTIRFRIGLAPGPDDREDPASRHGDEGETFVPPIDIHEGTDGLVLEADLPGATEQNLRIELEDNVLSLYATVDSAIPEGARLIHEEYRRGSFHRSFILSDDVDRDRIAAELKNGVLRLVLPKADRARSRRIEVKS